MAETYSELLAEIARNAGIDVSALPDNLYSTMLKAIAEAGRGTVIRVAADTTVNNYEVPLLTADDIDDIYNAVIVGRNVVVADKDEKMHFVVNQADVVGEEITVCFDYFNTMMLCYHDDGTIDYTEF